MVLRRIASACLGVAFVVAARPAKAADVSPFERERVAATAALEARKGKVEAVAPLAELIGLEDLVAPGAIEGALRGAAGEGAHPLVAAQASFQLARMLDQRGDEAGAKAARGTLGLLSRFWVVGPFGEGRAGHGQAFPPETEAALPAPGRTYRGKAGDVSWRSADALVRDGTLFLDGMLRPDTQGTAYVVAWAHSARDQDVALRFASPGPVKIWVGGALVLTRDVVRGPTFDQDAAPARLRRGWNRILVKTTVTDLPWRLMLRVTDGAGRAIDVGDGSLPPGAAEVPAARGRRPAAVTTLAGALRRRASEARAGAAGAEAWMDLGRYLSWAEPGDREQREANATLETARARRPTPAVLLLLADVARDEDERRRVLEAALALAEADGGARGTDEEARATRALVLARLGDAARAQRRDEGALARWRAALTLDAGCWPAALALAEEEQGAGLPFVALARVEALPGEIRQVPRVRRQWARLLDAAARRRDADKLLEEMALSRRRDVELLHELASRARTRGDSKALLARLDTAAALRPDLPSLSLELARAQEGAGDAARARETLEALATRLPGDATVLGSLGKLLHRQGRLDEALARVRAATALRPQDPELRRYADRLGAERASGGVDTAQAEASGEDLARRYAADARQLLDAKADRAAPGDGDAAVLLDRRVVRVHSNGLAQTFAQRLVAIRTDHGAEENKQFWVRYTPGNEEVEIRRSRVFRRGSDGALEVFEAADRDDQDLSEPWYGLYYDNRAEVVRFEGLRAGDVLEVQYLIEDVSAENQMADYFGDLQTIAETSPKRRWDYTLIAPATRPIYSNTPKLPRLEHAVTETAGERIYTFSARDVAAIEAEPAMPGLAEVAPYLHLSTYASWNDVGAWYWRLVDEQLAPDEEIRRAARAAVSPDAPEAEKVRAIHDLVLTGTRYVGLEFGIHGFKPYKVTQVLARRFGDCKDKASLLVSLLGAVGVEAELVLVRTRRGGRVETEPASLAVFDHAIAYVPKLDLYLDGTAEFSGVAELPTQDQGVMVLRVGPRGARLAETPVLPSVDNRVERRWSVALAPTGDAEIEENLSIRGQAAAEWREHYQTPGERRERYARVWTGRSPGARLVTLDMPGIEDRNRPVVARAVASVPRFGLATAGGDPSHGVTLPLTVREADFSRTYARLGARRQDLVIAYPWQHDEEIVYKLPAGWGLRGGGASRRVESPFGTLRLDVTSEPGGVVRVRSYLDVSHFRIAPADYAAFRAFLGDIDATFAARLAVGPGAAP
jgi:transglutaminase-like putative cysteine protease/tetratricopeptide (TPR) repeat protein